MFLNLTSGDKSVFDPNSRLQNILNLTPYETWQGSTLAVFDPSLEYVVYPRMSANSAELILFDVDKNRVITSVSPMAINFRPEWSPNGDSFVIVEPLSITTSGFPKQFELIKVTKTGETRRITDLNKKYPNTLINSYRWSPNGQFLAFWVNLDVVANPTTSYLAILSIETNELTITCLSSNINIYDYNPPIWSPGSTFLAVTAKVKESDVANLALVDIKNYSYSILDQSESLIPLGWLNFVPK
jgi:dipeptidyl aminopeptidase/acylaminoacyl peptidase